jgi:hypothetical protein
VTTTLSLTIYRKALAIKEIHLTMGPFMHPARANGAKKSTHRKASRVASIPALFPPAVIEVSVSPRD